MAQVFVTGGAGFFGSLLVADLLARGHGVTSIDLLPAQQSHSMLENVVGDIRDRALLDRLFAATPPEVVFHCAALLAHEAATMDDMWDSNVRGTEVLADAMAAAGIPHCVYLSSNCLWGHGFARPVTEEDAPAPCERYGESKWQGERILARHRDAFTTTTLRCPTIMDEGRLGLLAILFEFIAEGRRVWVVGGGANRYQFIYARDLIDAMLRGWERRADAAYGIGSDDVGTMAESYQYVIDRAGSGARVASLPKGPTILAMKLAHTLGISPLGPYQYNMIAESFAFDTTRIKADLGWRPTKTNAEMLWSAYRYYAANKAEIAARTDVSAHRKAADPGVIRLLKWVS